jgi:hypothetical protein
MEEWLDGWVAGFTDEWMDGLDALGFGVEWMDGGMH